jgi:hypothetical protein
MGLDLLYLHFMTSSDHLIIGQRQFKFQSVLHISPRRTKWHNRKRNASLGDREEEFQEESTTGTTPYASKFRGQTATQSSSRAVPLLSIPNPYPCCTPNLHGQPCLSHSRSAVHERHTHLQILKLALLI